METASSAFRSVGLLAMVLAVLVMFELASAPAVEAACGTLSAKVLPGDDQPYTPPGGSSWPCCPASLPSGVNAGEEWEGFVSPCEEGQGTKCPEYVINHQATFYKKCDGAWNICCMNVNIVQYAMKLKWCKWDSEHDQDPDCEYENLGTTGATTDGKDSTGIPCPQGECP